MSDSDRLTKDEAFMKNPDQWPKWPILPVVHHEGFLDHDDTSGFMFANHKFVVYVANIYDLPKGKNYGEVLDQCKKVVFNDLGALAKEWRVD